MKINRAKIRLTISVIGLLANGFLFSATVTELINSEQNALNALVAKNNGMIYFKDIPFTKTISRFLPKSVQAFMATANLTNVTITNNVAPYGFNQGYVLTGTTTFEKSPSQFTLFAVPNPNAINTVGHVIMINLPASWMPSTLEATFSKFNELKLSDARFVVADFTLIDKLTGIRLMSTEFNVLGTISLATGLLTPVKKWLDGMSKVFIVGDLNKLNIQIRAGFPFVTASARTMRIYLPVRVGLNFEELYRQGKLAIPSTILTSVQLSDVVLSLNAGTLELGGMARVAVGLSTQSEPLMYESAVFFNPAGVLLSVRIDNFDPAFGIKWLGLTKAGLQLETNYLAVAATGLPFTGIGLRGGLRLGKIMAEVGAKVSLLGVQSANVAPGLGTPEFGIYGRINRLDFLDFLALVQRAVKVIGNQSLQWTNMPTMRLTDATLSINPIGKFQIADERYPHGIMMKGNLELGPLKGFMDFRFNEQLLKLEGTGVLYPIKTPIFSVTGAGLDRVSGTADDGMATVLTLFPLKAPEFYTTAELEIPLLGLRRGGQFAINASGISGELQSTAFWGTLMSRVKFTIPFGKVADLKLAYEIDNTVLSTIKQKVAEAFSSLGGSADSLNTVLNQDIEKQKAKIKSLEVAIQKAQEQCKKKLTDDWNPFDAVGDCSKAAMSTMQKNLATARAELVKLTNKGINTVQSGLKSAFEALAKVPNAFEIRSIKGTLTGKDLASGRGPVVTLEIVTRLFGREQVRTISGLQFDFKNPINSVTSIFNAIKSGLSGSTTRK